MNLIKESAIVTMVYLLCRKRRRDLPSTLPLHFVNAY